MKSSEGYSHRYINHETGEPLRSCPECGAELTAPGSVVLVLGHGDGRNWNETTHLDREGTVLDVDGQITDGLHVDTGCSACLDSLADYEAF